MVERDQPTLECDYIDPDSMEDQRIREAAAHRRESRIRRLLKAIRGINQVIMKETDRQTLVDEACTILSENMGYLDAQIVLHLDGSVISASAGIEADPSSAAWSHLSQPIRFGDKTYGSLAVRVPAGNVHEEFERQLIEDVALGLSSALHRIEQEERRNAAEEALRESQRTFASLFHASPVAMVTVSISTRLILDCNETFLRNTGWTRDETVGHSLIALRIFVSDSDRVNLNAELERSGGVYGVEMELRGKDGSISPCLVSVNVVNIAGQPTLLASVIGIAERRRAEEALRQSESRLRSLYEESPLAYQSLAADGTILDVNQRWLESLGYTKGEAMGRWVGEFQAEEDRRTLAARLANLIKERVIADVECTYLRKDGTPVVFSIDARTAVHSDGSYRQTHCLLRDITGQKRLEAETRAFEAHTRQQQNLVSVGNLANGVAHEINNPLNIILNYGDLILDNADDPTQVRDYAGNIIRESERVASIVRTLLKFSQRVRQHRSKARVSDIVSETLSLFVSVLLKDEIKVESDVPADLPPIECRSQQLQQVVMNLLTNARDALNERFHEPSPDKRIRIHARCFDRSDAPWIRVSVSDQGGGIPPEIADHVFDPFFTTKGRERGPGLGLSISYGIVKEHDGELWFETEPGKGTTFHMDLPIVEGEGGSCEI